MRFLFMIMLLLPVAAVAQQWVDKTVPAEGEITLAEGVVIAKVPSGYQLWVPENGKPSGLLVFIHHKRDSAKNDLIELALSRNLAVMHTCTNNRLEWFFEDAAMQSIEQNIQEVLTEWKIPQSGMLYCGMSLGGTRALKLALFSQSDRSKYKLKPSAIAICDAPLDMVRFYREAVRGAEIAYSELAAAEGRWVSEHLRNNLGGPANDALANYISYSPYSFMANNSERLEVLKGIAVRGYTEPDIQWWIEHRRKDYYGMNAIDMAGLINELKIINHSEAELITTVDKGYPDSGERHPHTWNIVDEPELIEWFLGLQ